MLPITIGVFGQQLVGHFGAPRVSLCGSAGHMLALVRRIRMKVRQMRMPLRRPGSSVSLPMRVLICLSDQTVEIHFAEPLQVFTAPVEVWLALAEEIEASVTALESLLEPAWELQC